MKLCTLFLFCFVIVFFSIGADRTDGSNEKTKIVDKASALPVFTWINEAAIEVVFTNGEKDKIVLWPAEKIGDVEVACLHEGTLKGERSSSVVVSGCWNQPLVSITIHSNRLEKRNMFIIRNGNTEEVESPYVNGNPQQDYDLEDEDQEVRRMKRGILEDYTYEDYDDDMAADGHIDPPPRLQLNMKLGFEESLKKHLGGNAKAQAYAVEVFTHGRSYMKHGSLGTSLYLNLVGTPNFVANNTWKADRDSLTNATTMKVNEPTPIVYFCFDEDTDENLGISRIRRACDPHKGVGIVKWRENVLLAANTMSHECGHLCGLRHDATEDRKKKFGFQQDECDGRGFMSEMPPSERPLEFSYCSSQRFRLWYNNYGKSCLKDVTVPKDMKTCPYPLPSMIQPCSCKVDDAYRVYLFCPSINETMFNTVTERFKCNNNIHRLELNMMTQDLNFSFTAQNMGSLKIEFFHLHNVTNINADIGPNIFIGSAQTLKEMKLEKLSGAENNAISVQSQAFSNLVALKNIQLGGHFQTFQSKSFNNLPAVVNLKVTKIKTIRTTTFYNMAALKTLDLTESPVEIIQTKAFANLPHLTQINFNTGTLTNLQSKAFFGLQALQMLDLSGNKITKLETSSFDNLPNLSAVNLTRNKISQIDSTFINNTPKLSSIDLSHNIISSITTNTFKNLPTLTEIYLNDNKIATMQNDAFKTLPALTMLDLSQNDFEEVGNNLENTKNRDMVVNLSNTKIQFLLEAAFKGFVDNIVTQRGRGHINMNSVDLECRCDVHWIYNQEDKSGVNKFHNTRCKDGHSLDQVDSRMLELICPLQNCPQISSAGVSYEPERCFNGVATVNMKIEGRSVEVGCQDSDDGKAWTVIQRRGQFGNPEDHFARVWTEYENGFGSPQEEIWLGLRNMAALTKEGEWELQVDLRDWDGKLYIATYKKFSVGPGQRYELHVTNFDTSKSTLRDSLNYHNKRPFTTKDKDQDENSGGNCALTEARGGWWYGHCKHSNLNGLNFKTQRNDRKGIEWCYANNRNGGCGKTWKESVMKIRKVNP